MVNFSVNKQFIEVILRKSLADSHLNKTMKVNKPLDIIFPFACHFQLDRNMKIHNSWEEEPVALKVYKHMCHYCNVSA